MELDDKQLSRLKQLLTLLEPDVLTKEDFKTNFKAVVDFVKKIEKKNLDDFKSINEMIVKLSEKMRTDNESSFGGLQEKIKKETSEQIKKLTEQFEMKRYEIDAKMLAIKDGKDADEKRVVETVVKQIKVPEIKEIENNLPQLGTQIRDGLELLQGDERLDVSAIKGLEERLSEIKAGGKAVGGGFSKIAMDLHFMDDEALTGTKNGVNLDFTISHSPNPVSSLKVFRNGQRLKVTEDYTFTGRTVSFIVAPESDDLIYADYRI